MAKAATARSFSSILDQAPSEIKPPKQLPPGTYVGIFVGQPRKDKSAKKGTDFLEFTLKLLSAQDDVDQDDLAEALIGADGSQRSLQEIPVKYTVYYEKQPMRLKNLLLNAGLTLEDYETGQQAVEDTPGKQTGVVIIHEPSQDGTTTYARVDRTVALVE